MQQQKSKQIKYYKIRPHELCSIPSGGTGIVLLGVWCSVITGDLRLGILAAVVWVRLFGWVISDFYSSLAIISHHPFEYTYFAFYCAFIVHKLNLMIAISFHSYCDPSR